MLTKGGKTSASSNRLRLSAGDWAARYFQERAALARSERAALAEYRRHSDEAKALLSVGHNRSDSAAQPE